jgi:hypothetical protein
MASYDPNQTPLISETVLKRRRTLDELAYRRSSKFICYILLLLLFYILYYSIYYIIMIIISYIKYTK